MDIRTPDDFHLHLRQDSLLKSCAGYSASVFARALVMPNILPPVTTVQAVCEYREAIQEAAPGFTALMTFKLLPLMTGAVVEALKGAGCIAGKLYPAGATTNSADGVVSVEQVYPALEAMEEYGLVLCVHGELPEAPVLAREAAYIPVIERLAARYPKLRIVFEHLSTAEAVHAFAGLPDTVAGTVTAHHMSMTLDDLVGTDMNPYHFCKPVLKSAADRDAVASAAFGGSGRFFFGSDSAPHLPAAKYGRAALPGIFSAPVALPVVAEVFEKNGSPGELENFVSVYGARFYRLSPNTGTVTLEREDWKVPDCYGDLVPMMAGRTLRWKVIQRAE